MVGRHAIRRLGPGVRRPAPADIFIYAALTVIALAMVFPFYHVAIVSISNGRAVLQGRVTVLPIGFDLSSYKAILGNARILTAYRNTIVYTGLGTLISVALSAVCAYPISRPHFRGRKIFMALIVATMYFNGGMIPLYLLVKSLGMIDTLWAIVLPTAIVTYNMIVMRTFFSGIPEELHESAHMDGASEIRVFVSIVLPLSRAVLATMVLFYAVGHWNSYLPALLYLNRRSMQPLQMVLRNLVIEGDLLGVSSVSPDASAGLTTTDTSLKYAAIMVATIPILFVYPLIQKHFMKGVMIGSLKG